MDNQLNFWMAQVLILVFYIMTLFIYNRARNEYIGGKIGAAINLIMGFLLILFLSDVVDYFLFLILSDQDDTVQIIKILLRLTAICILFFGGLRFFIGKSRKVEVLQQSVDLGRQEQQLSKTEYEAQETVQMGPAIQEEKRKMPKLGRYEILEQIGRGAMGIVYKGRDPVLNRLTAIKTIRFSDEFDDDKVDTIKGHFYREAEVVAKLSHPNIVTIYDVGEDLDLTFLAMEFLQGESLEKYAHKDQLLPADFFVRPLIHVLHDRKEMVQLPPPDLQAFLRIDLPFVQRKRQGLGRHPVRVDLERSDRGRCQRRYRHRRGHRGHRHPDRQARRHNHYV